MDHFLPTVSAAEFENLKQGSMSVWDYHQRFADLSKHAIYKMPTFALNSNMNYGKMVEFSQATETQKLKKQMERDGNKKAEFASNFGGYFSCGKVMFMGGSSGTTKSFAQSSDSAPLSWPSQQKWSVLRPSQGNRGHIMRDYRSSRQNVGRGMVQMANSAAINFVAPPPVGGTPTPVGHGARGLGGPSRFYAMRGHKSSEASPDIVTGTLTVQSHDVYTHIDYGFTLSYVTSYVAMEFEIGSEQLCESLSISTLVGESTVATQVYRNCIVTVHGRDTMINLIELGMVDFDVIMGMDWLHSCFPKIDCRTRTIMFEFPNKAVIKWKGDVVFPKDRFISYLKAVKMINKGWIYHLIRVIDTDAEASTLESVPVVNEFLEVIPNELPGIPLDRGIDFCIDVLSGTQPILIPPYRMAPAELKELKN
ncbi:uncharacterized protein [Nicotiana tomentosiformis]|uniref:uncharacterized protein n=1 Tax=Nicotiana tomentosiformis TaxID=4098 RepID=UPI00388C7968